MNEPTKEQIDEARMLSQAYLWDNHGFFAFSIERLARLIAHIRARPAVPEGFALVPIEPTDEMCEAAWESEGTDYVGEHLRIWQIAPAYRAMIAVTQLKEPT